MREASYGEDADELPRATSIHMRQVLKSSELFAGSTEIEIEHEGSYYRLRRTSKGKLILTK